jgi:hypothetical protein
MSAQQAPHHGTTCPGFDRRGFHLDGGLFRLVRDRNVSAPRILASRRPLSGSIKAVYQIADARPLAAPIEAAAIGSPQRHQFLQLCPMASRAGGCGRWREGVVEPSAESYTTHIAHARYMYGLMAIRMAQCAHPSARLFRAADHLTTLSTTEVSRWGIGCGFASGADAVRHTRAFVTLLRESSPAT